MSELKKDLLGGFLLVLTTFIGVTLIVGPFYSNRTGKSPFGNPNLMPGTEADKVGPTQTQNIQGGNKQPDKTSAIEQAKTYKARAEALENEAGSLGFSCLGVDQKTCRSFIERTKSNQALKSALARAKWAGVYVYLSVQFTIRNGFITIDTRASDQEIIEFLIGK